MSSEHHTAPPAPGQFSAPPQHQTLPTAPPEHQLAPPVQPAAPSQISTTPQYWTPPAAEQFTIPEPVGAQVSSPPEHYSAPPATQALPHQFSAPPLYPAPSTSGYSDQASASLAPFSPQPTPPLSPAPIQNAFYPPPGTGPTYPNQSSPPHSYGPNSYPGPPPGLSSPNYPGLPPNRGGKGKLVGVIVVAALVAISAIGTGLFFLLRNDNDNDSGGSSSKSDKATPVQFVKSLLTAMEEGDADKVKDLYCDDPQDDSMETITGNLQEGDSYSITNYEVGDETEGSDDYTIEVRVEYIWTDDGTDKSFTEDLELILVKEKGWKMCGLNS